MEADDIEMTLLLEGILARYGHDLRGYRSAALRRRLQHAVRRTGARNLGDLQHRVLNEPDFFAGLLDELVVQVSEMFRDPPVYLAFRNEVVPLLRTYPQLRFWHAGCSSGEEVYSSAILLSEEQLFERTQIYATDLSGSALERARQGVYPADRLEQYTSNHRAGGGNTDFETYCSKGYEHLAMSERLRRHVVFFQHDLVGDQAFGQMHVVFCRNVLIYFDRELRLRVLRKLAEGLLRGGFLVLGGSEQLGRVEEQLGFAPFAPEQRIYRYRGESPCR